MFLILGLIVLATVCVTASRPSVSTIEPSITDIWASQATAPALSPVSDVKGVAFDRVVQIWLENTNYDMAAGDSSFKSLAQQGVTLSNFWAVTHPSMPNYIANVGGDHFGADHDNFVRIPSNVSTVVDLLDTKGISFGEYQEHEPYAGFEGFNYSNQQTFANDYVRKHNPLVMFDSITENSTRLGTLKNFTSFTSDLEAQTLPQWMFITPNMTNDGHDTSISHAAKWLSDFVTPLLKNDYFMNETLIVVTFDEDETYPESNRVFTLLLGGAVPTSLHGTEDPTFYTHYSTLSTIEANWGLPSLGRWDCGANVLSLVANKTGYTNAKVDTSHLMFNTSYPGPLSDKAYNPSWPIPDTNAKCGGRGVLSSVADTWGKRVGSHDYENAYPYLNGSTPNNIGAPLASGSQGSTPTVSATQSSPSASSKNTAWCASLDSRTVVAVAILAAAWT